MNVQEIASMIDGFANRNIKIWSENGKLKYKAAAGTVSQDDLSLLKQNKEDIICFLENEEITITEDKEHEKDAFALTEIQQAYVLGRSNAFQYGGVACHIYMELKYEELNPARVEDIWNQLIERHPMLRAEISMNGYQRVMEKKSRFCVETKDLRTLTAEQQEEEREKIKASLDHKVYDTNQWPMYTVMISKGNGYDLMHFSIEFLVADWLSIWTVLSEFESLYFTPEKELPMVDVTFRDYQIAEQKLRQGMKFFQDKKYWLERIKDLPKAPELPIVSRAEKMMARFERQQFLLESKKWDNFKKIASQYGVTPTAAVMTTYGMCLAKWSTNKDFCLNLSILNRLPLHPHVNNIVGDFTASSLLQIDCHKGSSFVDMVKRTNSQLFEDLDHRLFNGVQVLRELQKIHGNGTIMPYVFTSAIGLLTNEQSSLRGKMTDRGISQTPQVFLDCQAMDTVDGLNINLDSRQGIFPEGLIHDFKNTFYDLLSELSEHDELWNDETFEVKLPEWQINERKLVNETTAKLDVHLLQDKVMKQAMMHPDRLLVADAHEEWDGKAFLEHVNRVKAALVKLNIGVGDIVAVALPKSRWQIAACVGILEAGAAYVPLDVKHAKKRNEKILTKTKAKAVLCIERIGFEVSNMVELCIKELPSATEEIKSKEANKPEDLAYIIFTSGSTGEPKGVAISHKAAVNTIEDINRRYQITEKERVLQLSQLNFDLSVYDLFGVPSEGGAVIIPDDEQYKNPAHWAMMMAKYGVTVWNSVPALMQMFMIYLQCEKNKESIPLRLAMLSGDWIPIELPDKLMEEFENIRVVSLGGATEGGIWSVYHDCVKGEIEKYGYTSVPYGKPLQNQGYRVVDAQNRDCPVWVEGDLLITGESLANEYFGDSELTENAFVILDGERCYRTGDRGLYHPGGEIEFTGRKDYQVKLRGHRIELGEIEAVYKKYFAIREISCMVCEKNGEKVIVAAYVPKDDKNNIFDKREEILNEWLPNYMIPSYDLEFTELPLTANGKKDGKEIRRQAEERLNQEQAIKDNEQVENELEEKIAHLFEEILNVDSLGAKEDFYSAGANSLILARAAGKLNQEIDESIPFEEYLIQILNEPNVRAISRFIVRKGGSRDVGVEHSDAKESQEIYIERNDNTDKVFVVLKDKLPDEVMKFIASEHADRILTDGKTKPEEVIAEIKSDKQVAIIALDHNISQALEIAVALTERDILPWKVIMIEGDEETELETESIYMGDVDYILTMSAEDDKEEIREMLEEICYGEINLADGKNLTMTMQELLG